MKNTLTFERIIQHAHVGSMTESKIEMLTKQLDNGNGILTSSEQMIMYLHKYGAIHQAKLIRAFEHIPHKLRVEGAISIINKKTADLSTI